GPLTSPVVVLLMAIIYGLSTDYEVFLVSRMVEARARGVRTAEAIRSGVANTGRIITSAALILIVVTGAFAFSEIVMMKYIAFGMIAALIIDATVIRMLLVPAVMQMLGTDCWWAPQWMKRIQERLGLGEAELGRCDSGGSGGRDDGRPAARRRPAAPRRPVVPRRARRTAVRRRGARAVLRRRARPGRVGSGRAAAHRPDGLPDGRALRR